MVMSELVAEKKWDKTLKADQKNLGVIFRKKCDKKVAFHLIKTTFLIISRKILTGP